MKNRLCVVDTETCNIIKSNTVKPGNNLPYDVGYSIIEPATGKTILQSSNIVEEIFFGEPEKMNSAYYADKLPQYYEDIATGKRTVHKFLDIIVKMLNDCKRNNVVAIVAHNARFDIDAINTCFEYLYGFKTQVLSDYEIWDSMKMAKTFTDTPSYRDYCESHNFMTKHRTPRPRMTAEIIYRFISGDNDFVESHTALEDVNIEKEIVFKAYKTHKKMDKVLYEKI